MEYIMIIKKNRMSDAYIATYDVNDPSDAEALASLKATVSTMNRWLREDGIDNQFYVKLRGRGHRLGNPKFKQDLPLVYAETVDAYVYKRNPIDWK